MTWLVCWVERLILKKKKKCTQSFVTTHAKKLGNLSGRILTISRNINGRVNSTQTVVTLFSTTLSWHL